MADDIPFEEEPHVAMLQLGLKLKNCPPTLRKKLLVALRLRVEGGKSPNEDALILEVEKLRDSTLF